MYIYISESFGTDVVICRSYRRNRCRYHITPFSNNAITISCSDTSNNNSGRTEPYLLKIMSAIPSISRTLALNADKPDYDRLAKVRSAAPSRTRATILAMRASVIVLSLTGLVRCVS